MAPVTQWLRDKVIRDKGDKGYKGFSFGGKGSDWPWSLHGWLAMGLAMESGPVPCQYPHADSGGGQPWAF